MSISEAVRNQDRRASLAALRDKIAKTIDECESGRDIAALSKRLMEVMDEIDGLPDEEKETPISRRRAMNA